MTIEEQLTLLRRGTSEIISEADLAEKLKSGKPLRVKLGVDPTVAHVTLGWAVVLRKLRDFQRLGHTAVLIIGDFTAMIGDPSGKSKTRPQLSREEVQKNVEAVSSQVYKILDPDKTEIRFNGDWLGPMGFAEVIKLAAKTTVARIMERDDFTNRWTEHRPIALHEILYPLCQGYDSVAVESDIELGGNDQKFNNLVGRDLQGHYGQDAQVVMLCPLLVGTDGKEKMSQSLGNYISVIDSPNEMYGKTMSIPDETIENWFELCTDVPMEIVRMLCTEAKQGNLNPVVLKRWLASEIVKLYHPDPESSINHATPPKLEVPLPTEVTERVREQVFVLSSIPGVSLGQSLPSNGPQQGLQITSMGLSTTTSGAAFGAQSFFVQTFSKREQPVEAKEADIAEFFDTPVVSQGGLVSASDIHLRPLANIIASLELAKSNGAARDLIKAGAVALDGVKVEDPFVKLSLDDLKGKVLKVGKHQFRKLV